VKPADEQLIRGAVMTAAGYLRSTFGSTREDAVINIVASKTADDRPPIAQNAGCCTQLAGGAVYLDVDDPSWIALTSADKMKVSAHEYTHSFQDTLGGQLGCVGRDTDNPKRTPVWFYEGWAEYVAYQVALRSGWYAQAAVADVIRRAKADAAVSSLRMLSVPPLRGARGLYSLGWVAADRLTSIAGPNGVRDFCVAVARGNPWQEEFQKAFGVGSDAFQDGFNAYVLSLR
jgi:hypothetical protein